MVKNQSHTLAYSLIALQEMNLAYKYPIIFWNCACLISDAGGNEEEEEEELQDMAVEEVYYNEMEEFTEDDENSVEDSYDEDEDCDGYPVEVKKLEDGKKKKKTKTTNYGKIASAIGRFMSAGIKVAAPDINESKFTFSPDVDNNEIRYGLSGITRVGADLVKTILGGRPYVSVEDFLARIKVNKPQMVNLIKAGAFDAFGDRVEVMRRYIASISDQKKRVTLQNLKMLIDFGLIPDKYDLQRRVFYFNKYLKKMKLDDSYYGLDNIAIEFYSKNFDMDKLVLVDEGETESGFKIRQTTWDNIYQSQMDIIRPFVKKNAPQLLEAMNNKLMEDTWYKYCQGSISHWEMQSLSCYIHEHELEGAPLSRYGIVDFFKLDEQAQIDRYIPIKGKMIPLFKLERIAGTVLDRDKAKKTVTLLTTTGVVTVKIFGGVFAVYDKQISERGADGKKHVIEKSVFSRGNMIIVTGIRQEESFLAKTYSRTPYHKVEQIVGVEEDRLIIKAEREEEK